MARRLPPFAAIRAFEAAARHSNFRRASEELGLSPSAVSHQVKSLEDFLGIPLFHRSEGGLLLTPAGATYLIELREALDRIETATAHVRRARESTHLTVHLFPSLAALWLIPRLTRFQRMEPALDVRLVTSLEPIDFRRAEIDVAIRYATDPPPEHRADRMFDEELFVVCSPGYIERSGPIATLGDLAGRVFIHCETEPNEWADWLTFAGAPALEAGRRIRLDSRALALGAAADGLGIAVGRTPFVLDHLAAGRLVAPLPFRLRTGFSYYVVSPLRSAPLRAVASFRDWLLAECKAEPGAAPGG